MKQMLHYGLTLGIICLAATGLLATVNHFTKGRIIMQVQAEEEASVKEVLAAAESFEAVRNKEGGILYYRAYAKNGDRIGAAFTAETKGYSSVIQTMVGMDNTGRISAIKIISQNETPGLGSRVTEPSFTSQFTNKDAIDLSGVQAIAGATISSAAVIESVRKKSEEIGRLLKNEK